MSRTVDPGFADELRRRRQEAGLSLRELAGRVHYSRSYLHEFETGAKAPTVEVAERLDAALGSDGALAAMVGGGDGGAVSPDDVDRVRHVADRPGAVDPAAVESLRAILAHQRRLEDVMGAAAVEDAAVAQAAVVDRLADEARGSVRRAVVDLAGQWAQFVGWLHAATGQPDRARQWYARTLEHATEIDDPNLSATALSMRGNLAWHARQPGPLIGLSAAAADRRGVSAGVRAVAVQQQARGHALAGDSDDVDRLMDQAVRLAADAADHPDREPPWIYFFSPQYLSMQRGLAYRLLGRRDDAIRHLSAGLAAMPADVRGSEFVNQYVLHLAVAHHEAGDADEARHLVEQVRAVATATGSQRLGRQVDRLARRWGW